MIIISYILIPKTSKCENMMYHRIAKLSYLELFHPEKLVFSLMLCCLMVSKWLPSIMSSHHHPHEDG